MRKFDEEDPDVLRALKQALRRYFEAWNADDGSGQALAPMFVYPWVQVTPDGMTIHSSPEDTARFFRSKRAEVAEHGWVESTLEAEHHCALEQNLGVVTIAWSRRDGGGSPFVSGRSFYTFIRDDGQWKLVSMIFNY